jgi:hypothetical protein
MFVFLGVTRLKPFGGAHINAVAKDTPGYFLWRYIIHKFHQVSTPCHLAGWIYHGVRAAWYERGWDVMREQIHGSDRKDG